MSITIIAVFSARPIMPEKNSVHGDEAAGCSSLVAGQEVEHPDTHEVLLSYRVEQIADDQRAGVHEALGLPHPALRSLCHVNLRPDEDFRTAVESPVTEVARFYFRTHPGESILTRFLAFREVLYEHKVAGFSGFATGLSRDVVKHADRDAYVAVLLMGWTTIAAHEAFQQTQLFKDSLHLLPIEQASDIEQHHTAFRPVLRAQRESPRHGADA